MNKRNILLEKLKVESKEDFQKFRIFAELGISRTLDQAYKIYYDTAYAVPARWKDIAERYRWLARATDYDQALQQLSK